MEVTKTNRMKEGIRWRILFNHIFKSAIGNMLYAIGIAA